MGYGGPGQVRVKSKRLKGALFFFSLNSRKTASLDLGFVRLTANVTKLTSSAWLGHSALYIDGMEIPCLESTEKTFLPLEDSVR